MPSIITDGVNTASATITGASSAALNLTYGGQNGYMPRIGRIDASTGKYVDEWINNHAYIKQNVIPILLSYPKGLDYMPEKEKWIRMFKALVETHPESITGLSSGLIVTTEEHAIGGDDNQQSEITDVKRAQTTLTFTFREKAGKAIQKYLDYLIRYLYKDPQTKSPLIRQYITDLSTIGSMYLPDMWSATILFIEPDILNRYVVDAWLCSNVVFKGNGDRTGSRDIHAAGEMLELSIEATPITLNNENVMTLAGTILKQLTILDKIPDTGLILPTNGVDSTLSSYNGFEPK